MNPEQYQFFITTIKKVMDELKNVKQLEISEVVATMLSSSQFKLKFVMSDESEIETNTISLPDPHLYLHHIVISTVYGGSTKYLVVDYYSTDSEAYTLSTYNSKSIHNKLLQWTGNIMASDGTTTGICSAKIYKNGANNTVEGINSSGVSFYAGIQTLTDTVSTVF